MAAGRVVYVATARAEDAEMEARIARHREERPAHWATVEAPLDIGREVEAHSGRCDLLLLDCLTVWLSNFCWEHRERSEAELRAAAFGELTRVVAPSAAGNVVLVTNEVGCGLVPESPVGRQFRDLQGWVNQEAARAADWVYHVVAGIPVAIKRPEGRE
jgi:adenosylcobinamide kinase/adenosylcobinamide-phosphate guanylyltransferase